jgi:hypothetical protein
MEEEYVDVDSNQNKDNNPVESLPMTDRVMEEEVWQVEGRREAGATMSNVAYIFLS